MNLFKHLIFALSMIFALGQSANLYSMQPQLTEENKQQARAASEKSVASEELEESEESEEAEDGDKVKKGVCSICQEKLTDSFTKLSCCDQFLHLKCLLKCVYRAGFEKEKELLCPLCKQEFTEKLEAGDRRTVVLIFIIQIGTLDKEQINVAVKLKKKLDGNAVNQMTERIKSRVAKYLFESVGVDKAKKIRYSAFGNDLLVNAEKTQIFPIYMDFKPAIFTVELASKVQSLALRSIVESQCLWALRKFEYSA